MKIFKDIVYALGVLSVFLVPILGVIVATNLLEEPNSRARNLIVIISQVIGSALALRQLGDILGL